MGTTLERRIYKARDGVEIVADCGGPAHAPCVILLHGGGQTRHSWSHAVERLLEAGLQVINYDARGHGDSGWSQTGSYSLADRASDLALVASDVDSPYLLVGASLGGATSLQAVHDGLRPSGLVLVDIVPQAEEAGVSRIVEFMAAYQGGFNSADDAADAVAAYNPDRPRPRNADGLMKNLRRRDDGRLYWHWDPQILAGGANRNREALRKAADTLADLPGLPVLLVRGMASDVVSDAGIAALRAQIPRLELLDVEGAGHMVAGDRNDAFSEGVIAFAKRTLLPV